MNERERKLNRNPNFFIFCRQKKEKTFLLLLGIHSICLNALVYDVEEEKSALERSREILL